jgi:hypothetical protein
MEKKHLPEPRFVSLFFVSFKELTRDKLHYVIQPMKSERKGLFPRILKVPDTWTWERVLNSLGYYSRNLGGWNFVFKNERDPPLSLKPQTVMHNDGIVFVDYK